MNRKVKVGLIILLVVAIIGLAFVSLRGSNVAVFNPAGTIAEQEQKLIIITVVLGLVVVIPVFVMLFTIAWKYREGSHKKVKYEPNWDNNHVIEAIWWGIPCIIIGILGVIMWKATHDLDPFKPIDSSVKPVKVQVIALQWKWLFLYPDQHVASLNALPLPVNTPVDFEITSDAPMNSFWIPNLSGQIYAMSGMSTQLHIMADKTGDYKGSSANISGEGFADMTFTARVTSRQAFDAWAQSASHSLEAMDALSYQMLAKPSKADAPKTYRLGQDDLYDTILMKYMMPETQNKNQSSPSMNMQGMDMSNMEMN